MKQKDGAGCDHHHKAPASKAELRSAKETARTVATQAGLKWTAQRERALELLLEAKGPVKAYDLVATFQPGGKTAPPTVYRALDALVDLGLAHKIPSRNAYVACAREDHAPHTASFLFCDCCGAVEEFDAPLSQVVASIRDKSEFELRAVTIEVHGLCGPCRGGRQLDA